MDGVLKKGVALIVVLFLGWYLIQDPSGLGSLAQELGTGLWELLVNLFEGVVSFLGAFGEE